MPELPEVETVRRGLNQVTLGRVITRSEVLLDRTIAYPEPSAFATSMTQCTIETWHRRGKYLLAQLSQNDKAAGWWGVHLRMTGQLIWTTPDQPVQKHTRVRVFFEAGQELRFIDTRTFGQMWRVPVNVEPPQIITGLKNLGPEPFSPEFSVTYLAQWLAKRKRPIKNALLDQSLVAGVGNIYADEALFLSQIHPLTWCADLNPSQIAILRDNLIQVLNTSIEAKGTTFSDFRTIEGINGNYGGQAWVYSRNGQPCKTCATPIDRLKLAGRSAHFCPTCQPPTNNPSIH